MSCRHGNHVALCDICEEVDDAWDRGYSEGGLNLVKFYSREPENIPASLVRILKNSICKEFGINGTDGYYLRILQSVFEDMASASGGEKA